MTETQLVKADLAARATGLNKFFLYRLAAERQIPCYRLRKAVRFSIPELLEWMKQQAIQKASSANGHNNQKEEL